MAELPEGYKDIPEEDRKKAKQFFDRGNTVAGTGNYEYAIEMYLSGLKIDPDAVEAHATLRDISLKRKASGGKSLGFWESSKLRRPTKDDVDNLINSEKLLAYDPGNIDCMVGVLTNALRAGFFDTVMWIGPILQQANADSGKPSVDKFLILKDAYKSLHQWKLASDACHYAVMLKPDDMDLQRELKDLGATQTMKQGNYASGGSFRDSIKDMEGQAKRLMEDKDVRTMDQLGKLITAAEAEWKADPEDSAKLMKFVDVLVKTEQPDYENRAIDLLQAAFDKMHQFRFRQNIGKIRMMQMNRMERSLRQAAAQNPTDAEAKQAWSQFAHEKLEEELKEFQLWAENYPTESTFKFEAAKRMFQLGQYDLTIPLLQQVRADPKYRHDAGIVLGQAFLGAKFIDEAVDTLATVIGEYQVKGDRRSIEMTYWYGRASEQKNDPATAIKAYSQVAQWEFNYRDVQARIKKLRAVAATPEAT